jgi:hypothetical protein
VLRPLRALTGAAAGACDPAPAAQAAAPRHQAQLSRPTDVLTVRVVAEGRCGKHCHDRITSSGLPARGWEGRPLLRCLPIIVLLRVWMAVCWSLLLLHWLCWSAQQRRHQQQHSSIHHSDIQGCPASSHVSSRCLPEAALNAAQAAVQGLLLAVARPGCPHQHKQRPRPAAVPAEAGNCDAFGSLFHTAGCCALGCCNVLSSTARKAVKARNRLQLSHSATPWNAAKATGSGRDGANDSCSHAAHAGMWLACAAGA